MSVLEQVALHMLPQTGVAFSFGYGSKVVKQAGKQSASDLIDVIIAVEDPLKWHQENLNMNRQHYSFIRYLPNSAELITRLQEDVGARIYFNPYVRFSNVSLKYGIIKLEHMIEDLTTWNMLYVSGRLHKPVEVIIDTSDKMENLRSAIKFNRESAIRCALLQLPEVFDSFTLYETIVGLSYHGDPRMIFGEDKHKIKNIVSSQIDRLDQIYLPILKTNSMFRDSIRWNETKQTFTQDLSSSAILRNLKLLPKEVRRTLCEVHSQEARTIEPEIILASASKSIICDKILAQSIAIIVRRSSLSQSLKGVITAGFLKSIRYSQRKLIKSFKSRLNWAC